MKTFIKKKIKLYILISITILFGLIALSSCSSSKKITLVFYPNNNEVIDIITLDKNELESYTLPTPSKEGYTFDDWYFDNEYNNIYDSSKLNDAGIYSLYAKYNINSYTINIHYDEDIIYYFNYNELIELDELTKDDYIFDGYYLDENLTNEFKLVNMPSYNIDLYPKFTNVNHYYNVNYRVDYNKGYIIGDSIQLIKENELSNEIEVKALDGYRFISWDDGNESSKRSDLITNDITYNAIFEKVYKYTLVFYPNNDEVINIITLEKDELESYNLPTPSKEGYTFDGWYFDNEYNNIFDSSKLIDSGIYNLYAKYDQIHYHIKGDLIDIPIIEIDGIPNPGLFLCAECQEEYYDTIEYDDLNLPILSITGDLTGISKENKVQVLANYADEFQTFEYNATLKLQGATSLYYPKKNYNIQFYKDNTFKSKQKVKLISSWGSQNKYTLKANWIDYSQMRNVISAKIYGDIVRFRDIDDEFNDLVNGGAIDGYPIIIFENGVYQGLYTLNMAKDDYLFAMNGDESTKEAILMTVDWTNSCALKEHINYDFSNGWELEYSSTEDNDEIGNDWVVDSFNNMIDFINNNDGDDFINGINEYIYLDRAIDSMLYIWFIGASDNYSKNILWVTYDGIRWMPSVYDMDATWGLLWYGGLTDQFDLSLAYSSNLLWEKIWINMQDLVIERYAELRNGPLSFDNVSKKFIDFYKLIPGIIYEKDKNKWNGIPSTDKSNILQILNWCYKSIIVMDDAFNVNIDETLPFKASFICDEHVKIEIYMSNDYELKSSEINILSPIAFATDSSTGYITNSGDGQINFKIILDDGYEIDSINIIGSYKNLKDPIDTKVDNVYRITKITSDLIINITTKLK